MKRIYMDHAATTPVDKDVVKEMLPFFTEKYGNPSSLHSFGREAYNAMEKSRENIASLINADKDEIFFTSGGTESDNIAIKGIAYKMKEEITDYKGPHIITSVVEHPAVMETCRHLEKMGLKVKYLPVDKYGIVSIDELENSISKGTFLISVMHANNEIGTIQNIDDIGKIAKEHDIVFHSDAVQSAGKIPVDVKKIRIDLLSMSSHKIYGPKGVGALYIRKGVKLEPMIHGGGHEKGLRSGTENIPGIVGFGKACELAKKRLNEDAEHLTILRDKLIKNVLNIIEETYLNGHPEQRLSNNAHFRFTGIEGEALILSMDEKGIAASTGSACSSKKLLPSHVLMAIGLNEIEAHGSLRLTLGRENTDEDVRYVIDVLPGIVEKLRKMSSLWGKKLEIEKWKKKMKK
ncbi:MAG: cysteine desulfurase NifS [Euryarchaeota archaeon CG_4_9_14_3_um_filter_38_12]|nr:MAG: cysteine desulfurase NifS [Euryarchaeota archaeon CG_4_9_14_3_um_filter_38_12]